MKLNWHVIENIFSVLFTRYAADRNVYEKLLLLVTYTAFSGRNKSEKLKEIFYFIVWESVLYGCVYILAGRKGNFLLRVTTF